MIDNYNKISLDDMMAYIEKDHPEDKAWFKQIAFQKRTYTNKKTGKVTEKMVYSHLTAKKEFCKKYFPDLIPVATVKKVSASAKLANW